MTGFVVQGHKYKIFGHTDKSKTIRKHKVFTFILHTQNNNRTFVLL